ncbi:LY75 [Mytilus coruscus]|uniref:LY75 n=1 Tax=Mytilus coruscus TaxID=42192 RepID=A0A6J8D188_MYTCO|nr:LY75 [Mytilus coruscus]
MRFVVFFASCLLTLKGAPTADQCSFPYRRIGEGCYLIINDTVSGDAAFAKCLHRGLYLATFETINESMLMKFELLKMNAGVHYFVGGRNINRYTSGGDWRWIKKNGDMVKMTYFAFDDGEPNGSLSAPQDCMCFYASRKYTFHAVWCENGGVVGGYICQRHI